MRLRTVNSRLRLTMLNRAEKLEIYNIMRGISDKKTIVGARYNNDWINALNSIPDKSYRRKPAWYPKYLTVKNKKRLDKLITYKKGVWLGVWLYIFGYVLPRIVLVEIWRKIKQ